MHQKHVRSTHKKYRSAEDADDEFVRGYHVQKLSTVNREQTSIEDIARWADM